MMPAEHLGPPVRMEVGTSEIEGGQCRAWADPTLVVAAVAMSYPEDTFTRLLEPRLNNLDQVAGAEGMDDLPPALRGLLARLKETHVRLYQDNRSLRHEPSWVELACAVAEEDRVYFVRTSPSWICLLRGGKAIAAERGNEDPSRPRTGLGSSEKLRLEVTSLAIEPDDVVVLLSSESSAPPDLRAMARLFSQSNDLKRVCDGVVNLLGLQAQGASAVAIRFVAIQGGGERQNALAGLIDWPGTEESASGAQGVAERTAGSPTEASIYPIGGGMERRPGPDAPRSAPPNPPLELVPEPRPSEPRFLADEPTPSSSIPETSSPASGSGESSARQSLSEELDSIDPFALLDPLFPGESSTSNAPISAQATQEPATAETPAELEDWDFPWEEGGSSATSASGQVGTAIDPGPAREPIGDAAPPAAAPVLNTAQGSPVGASSPTGAAVSTGANTQPAHPASSAEFPPARSLSPEAAMAVSATWPAGGDSVPAAMATGAVVNAAPRKRMVLGKFQVPILVAIVAFLITVIILLLAALPGRGKQSGKGAKGQSQLWLEPSPAALHVYLDGDPVAGATPTRVEGLSSGKHQLALDLGICGTWKTEVELNGKEPLRVAPRLTGSVEVVGADPGRSGFVWVQGREKVAVPARLDSLPIGWVHLLYEDENVALWDRPVLVKGNGSTRVVMPNHLTPGDAMVKVESLRFRSGSGLEETRGDSVFVDHLFQGETPFEAILEPGVHSVRVRSADGEYTDLVDLRPGGLRYVPAQFGLGIRPQLSHRPPGRVVARGPVALSVNIGAVDPSRLSYPTLHLPEAEAGSREVPLTAVDGSDGTYAGLVDPRLLLTGSEVRYYFSVVAGKEKVYSDIFRLRADRGTAPRRATAAAVDLTPPDAVPPDEALEAVPSQP